MTSYEDDAFDRAMAASSKPLPAAHYNRGIALLGLDRRAEAIEAFERSVALAPTLAMAHFNLARALEVAGDGERAAGRVTTSISLAFTPAACSSSSARPVRRVVETTSGVRCSVSSTMRPIRFDS